MEKKPWFKTVFRGYLLDFQIPETEEQTVLGQPANLRNLDVKKICDQLARAHVKATYIHAKDNQGNCYYNTGVGHKHKGIGDRDIVAEFIEELHKRDIIALLYVQMSRDRRSWQYEEHRARLSDGTPFLRRDATSLLPSKGDYPICCLNGPHREYIIAILKELTANYDMEGFWLDNWEGLKLPCYCEYCKAKFREDTGLEIPEKPDWKSLSWRTYYEWRKKLNTEITREVIEAIKSIKPHVSVTRNGAGFGFGVDMEGCCDCDDYVSSEFHSFTGFGNLSQQCEMERAMSGGKSFEVEIWRFFMASARGVQRGYQVKPLDMYRLEMFSVLAHGGIIQFYDQINLDGTLEPRVIELLEKVYSEVMIREEWLVDAKPIEFAALYWSKYTNDYHGGNDKYLNYLASFDGAYYSMMEEHIPFNIVMDRQLTTQSLSDYKVLVMPNAVCLSDEQAEAIRKYVKEGGGLVATYRTSLANLFGSPRKDFALSDVFHANYIEPLTYRYSYIKIEREHPVTKGIYMELPMTMWKALQLKVMPFRDVEVVGKIVYPYRGFQMGNPPLELTRYPAILVSRFGKGRVVYFSGEVDSVYAQYGHPDYKRLLANAIRWAAATRAPVEVDAPATVEIVVSKQTKENRLIIHLVNYTSVSAPWAKGRVAQETIPIHNIKVRAKKMRDRSVGRVYFAPENKEMTYVEKESYIEVEVPRLEVHGMIVIE